MRRAVAARWWWCRTCRTRFRVTHLLPQGQGGPERQENRVARSQMGTHRRNSSAKNADADSAQGAPCGVTEITQRQNAATRVSYSEEVGAQRGPRKERSAGGAGARDQAVVTDSERDQKSVGTPATHERNARAGG